MQGFLPCFGFSLFFLSRMDKKNIKGIQVVFRNTKNIEKQTELACKMLNIRWTVTAVNGLVPIMEKAKLSRFPSVSWSCDGKGITLPGKAAGCDYYGLWRWVLVFLRGSLCKHKYSILDDFIVCIWDHISWHRKLFCLCGGSPHSLLLPSDKALLLMAVMQYRKSLNLLLVGLNVIVKALHTNTSSVRSCLLQHLFIGGTLFEWRNIFLSAFTFHKSYLHPEPG